MRIRDMRIGTQLGAGLSITLILVVVLAFLALDQAQQLWETTSSIKLHPLTVQRAIGKMESDVWYLRNGMKVFILVDDEDQRGRVLKLMAEAEADAKLQFNILYDRYLGSRADIDTVFKDFEMWKVVRTETFRLLHEGKKAEVIQRTLPEGANAIVFEHFFASLDTLRTFADRKAESFYSRANELRTALVRRFSFAILAILFLAALTGLALFRNIRTPLKEMTGAAALLAHGNLDTRIKYHSRNEFGFLADSLNHLADTVQTEIKVRDSIQRLTHAIVQEETVPEFVNSLLTALGTSTDALFSAMYRLNSDADAFELTGSFGLSKDIPTTFSASKHEGPFALAIETHQVQGITEIPEDTIFIHPTVAGQIVPKEMIVVPIVSGKSIIAMLVVGSLRPFSPTSMRILEDSRNFIAARLTSIISTENVILYSDKLEIQNRELETQSMRLSLQSDELTEQNTELIQQKRQLDEANKMKSIFLSNMSHELRTPLNSVIALSGVLNRRLDGTIPHAELGYLKIIERNGQHLLTLINDILDLSRIEAGREELTISPTPMQTLVREVAEMFAPQAAENGIALSASIDDKSLLLMTDSSKCRQVLINLVGNAIKFTDTGYVRLSAAVVGDRFEIVVSDSGIGIAPEHLDEVFREFMQVDGSRTRRHGGSGLGLAISKKYAQLLGGDITIESEAGKGSRFTFSLPIQSGNAQSPNVEMSPRSEATETVLAAAPSSSRSILLVEDSEPAVIQLRDVLLREGYEVLIASTGSEALRMIAERIPDVMILDLMMPEIDGFEVLRIIRSQERTSTLPVLILTAKHITKEELAFLKGNNIKQLIQKGDVSIRELLTAVSNMFDDHPSTYETRAAEPKKRDPDRKPRVLIIEDNPDNMTTVVALLSDSCVLLQACDGQTGLHLVRNAHPDIVLCDISLPGLDGFTVLEYIRQDPAIRDLPVVALTARAMQSDVDEILAHGFDAYISKPVDAQTLKQQIFGILDEIV